MRKSILLLPMLLLVKLLAFSQVDERSTLIGNPSDNEMSANIVADPAGNTYVAGVQNKKGLVVRQNALHQVIWMKTLAFTNNPADETIISFMDLVGDTLFGCGTVRQSNQLRPFYFKLNAQTGNPYWAASDLTSNGFFSCMRYANGKFFLAGAVFVNPQILAGKVIAISSQTGNLVWETPLMNGILPNSVVSVGMTTAILSTTEVYNGKFYLTGYCMPASSGAGTAGTVARPFLIGIHENGTVFLEKWLNLPQVETFTHYHGQKIHLDSDKNLVIGSYRMQATVYDNMIVTKCDTLGNLLFCKGYKVNNSYSPVPVDAMNETDNNYVFFGTLMTAINGAYTLKTDKNGNVIQTIAIDKPFTSCTSMGIPGVLGFGVWNNATFGGAMNGNSRFINGQHYFVTSEATSSAPQEHDINQIILDEALELVDDCSGLIEIQTSVNTIAMTIQPLPVMNYSHTLNAQSGVILEDIPSYDYCDHVSLDLMQQSGCTESLLTANTAGFTSPTFYWSDGTVSSVNTQTVNTTDTVIVRVLDTKCCELIDTIVPFIAVSDMTMQLPADTTVCLQAGTALTLLPVVQNSNTSVQYLWSNNTTNAWLSVTASGTYWVEVSDSCKTIRDSIVVTVAELPVISNTAPLAVCEGNFPVDLTPVVSAGATVLWEDGSTVIPRSISGAGTYTLEAENVCGTVSATIHVSQSDLPEVLLNSLIDTCIQNGTAIVLTPVFSGATTVLWSDGSTGNQLVVSASGTYTVAASNVCGVDSASCTVTMNYFPELNLPAVLDTCFETGVGFAYTAQGSGGSYQWNSGSQTATEWIDQEGMYSCTLTNGCGSIADSMLVSRIALPEITFVSALDTCIQNGAMVVLTPVFSGATAVLWSDGSTGNQLVVSASGTYTVAVFNVCGADSASCVVTMNYFPELNLPAVLDTCFEAGVGFAYTAQGSGGSYQWSSGSASATEWIDQEGMYSCTLTNGCGSITDSMQVRRFTEINLVFPEDSIRDCQRQLSVSALQVETNYTLEIFSPGSNPVGSFITESGWYTLHAFNPCAEVWDSIYVNLQNEQFFYLPNSFTPNGDTHNERYELKGENMTVRSIRIFNRWGEEVFSETGDFSGWDGTYRGEMCPTGIYAVSVIYEDCFGMPTEFNGHVNVLR